MIGTPFATIGWAFIGGVVPTFFWLWFWLRNDRNPEPRGLITLAFIAGAATVPLIIPVQHFLFNLWGDSPNHIAAIAGAEELIKFAIIALAIFPTRFIDEPVDYGMYLITAALGFAALENMLFLLNPLQDANIALTLAAGNLRFFGATVLHALSAAVVGISMGVVFYKPLWMRGLFAFIGVGAATALHALFNFFIMKESDIHIVATISILWVVGIFISFAFRKLSQLYRGPRRRKPKRKKPLLR